MSLPIWLRTLNCSKNPQCSNLFPSKLLPTELETPLGLHLLVPG
jgi:hypothetical protein